MILNIVQKKVPQIFTLLEVTTFSRSVESGLNSLRLSFLMTRSERQTLQCISLGCQLPASVVHTARSDYHFVR